MNPQEVANALQGMVTGGIVTVVLLVVVLAVATWLPSLR